MIGDNLPPHSTEFLYSSIMDMDHIKFNSKSCFFVLFITAPVTACTRNPCLNGGSCSENGDKTKYICNCSAGFKGKKCQGKKS